MTDSPTKATRTEPTRAEPTRPEPTRAEPTRTEPTRTEPTRTTWQRRAVHAVLDQLDGFASAQDIHEHLRRGGDRVGLSTVYRTLQHLADAAEVDVLRTDDGEALYRRCSAGHHHHLVCRTCGRTVEVAGPTVERWADRVAADHGFRNVSHTLEVFGVCPLHG